MNGIESVRKHAGDDRRYERTHRGQSAAPLNPKAANGQVIGTSQLYADKDGMENGIRSVATHAPDAAVVEEEPPA